MWRGREKEEENCWSISCHGPPDLFDLFTGRWTSPGARQSFVRDLYPFFYLSLSLSFLSPAGNMLQFILLHLMLIAYIQTNHALLLIATPFLRPPPLSRLIDTRYDVCNSELVKCQPCANIAEGGKAAQLRPSIRHIEYEMLSVAESDNERHSLPKGQRHGETWNQLLLLLLLFGWFLSCHFRRLEKIYAIRPSDGVTTPEFSSSVFPQLVRLRKWCTTVVRVGVWAAVI